MRIGHLHFYMLHDNDDVRWDIDLHKCAIMALPLRHAHKFILVTYSFCIWPVAIEIYDYLMKLELVSSVSSLIGYAGHKNALASTYCEVFEIQGIRMC